MHAGCDWYFIYLQLQLYAKYQKIKAPIDNSYTASSHSVSTLESWYDKSHSVGNLAMSSQLIFPLLITVYVFLFLVFILELKPYKLSKKLQNELDSNDSDVRAKADSSLLTKFVASTLFHLFTLSLDITAAVYQNEYLSNEIKDYYEYDPQRFWYIPIIMIGFDSITFVIFICLPPVAACCSKNRSYLLIYSLISPLSCVASHSYHIVFAFIIDPYHATSIMLIYAIIAFVHILTFQKLFYYINTVISGEYSDYQLNCCGKFQCLVKCINTLISCVCNCCHIKKRYGRYCLTIVIFILEFIFMGVSIGISISLIMVLPFSNALDDAPNHLYVIYQASVAFFAALIAFQVLFRQNNTTFDVYIKAIDGYVAKPNEIELHDPARDQTKTWSELSEREKETLLAKVALTYLTKHLESDANVNFIGTELDHVFPQTSDSSSADAGGRTPPVKEKDKKKGEQQHIDVGSLKPSSGADGHSPRDKQVDSSSDSPQSNMNAGGCFSCCCRKREPMLLVEEPQEEIPESPSSAGGHSRSDSSKVSAGGATA